MGRKKKKKQDESGLYTFSNDQEYYRQILYVPLEDLDEQWIWTEAQIKQFDTLWKKGVPIKKIAAFFGKYETTILVVWLDRYIKGELRARQGWNLW